MTYTTVAQYAGQTKATSHTITFTTATTPGSSVLVIGRAPGVIAFPAGWVLDSSMVDGAHSFVARLPAADNAAGISSVTVTCTVSVTLTAMVLEAYIAGAPTYTDFTQGGLIVSGGTLWGTGLHTFAGTGALAVFWGTVSDGTMPGVGESMDQGYTLLGQAKTYMLGGTGGDPGAWIVVGTGGALSNDGVTLTINPAAIPGVTGGSGDSRNGFIVYEPTTPPPSGTSWGATISEEIGYPGDDPSQFAIGGAGSTDAHGFARQTSVNVGDTVDFAVHSTSCTTIDIYRIGGYDTGWRKVDTIVNTPTSQPAPQTIANSNGATECSNWTTTASWTVPTGAWSGMFVAVARVTGDAFWIPFVVRQDSRDADLVVKTSETTWGAAYNGYGAPGSEQSGRTLYTSPRSYAVSFDRPVITRATYIQTYWLAVEAPLWAFLDKQGVDWKLIASVDLDAGLTAVGAAKAIVSSGHDEYWSQGMRDNVEAFRDSGGHLIFMTGNGVFWRVRFSPDRRIMWCYKDTLENGVPTDPVEWTGTWQDTRWVDRDPGANLQGTTFRLNGVNQLDIVVDAATYGGSPFWRGTTVETGTNLTLTGSLGFEADEVDPQTSNYVLLADKSEAVTGSLSDDNGQFYTLTGTLNWGIVLMGYGGSAVVGFGVNHWGWALDTFHDRGSGISPSAAAKQATINLLTDMRVTVADPEAGLTVPTRVGFDTYGLTGFVSSDAVGFLKSDGTRWWNIPLGSSGDVANTVAGEIAAHEASADPHPEYLTPAEHSAISHGLNVTGTPVDGAIVAYTGTSPTWTVPTAVTAADIDYTVSDTVAEVLADLSARVAALEAAGPTLLVIAYPPEITGTFVEGNTVTCSSGAWNYPPDTYDYQWNRSGSPIGGATANTYTLTAADVGTNTITCTVIANKVGYASGSGTSNAITVAGLAAADLQITANSQGAATSSTTRTTTCPTVAAGDLIMVVAVGASATDVAVVTGLGTLTVAGGRNVSGHDTRIYTKVADGTESGATVTATTTGALKVALAVAVLHSDDGALEVKQINSPGTSGGTSATSPSYTATSSSFELFIGCTSTSDATTAQTIAQPSGHTLVTSAVGAGTSGGRCSLVISYPTPALQDAGSTFGGDLYTWAPTGAHTDNVLAIGYV